MSTNTITTQDGTRIFYKDWGTGQPVVFSHGWPLNADAWDDQMLFVASHGYRAIAHDRRGHGRSSQPWDGNDMDTYADDLAALIETLDVHDVVLVGHSTGGGEVTHYIGRHGTSRVAKALLVGAVPPLMLKTDIQSGWAAHRGVRPDPHRRDYGPLAVLQGSQCTFLRCQRPGAQVSQGVRDAFWLMSMQVGIKAAYDCIKAFSETDMTEDLLRFDIPTLIIHGDDDQIVPFSDSAPLSSKLVKDATLKVYPGADHGLTITHKEQQFNEDLLSFLKS